MPQLFRRATLPDQTTVEIDGRAITVQVRRIARARHYRLTVDTRKGPVLTVPGGGRWAEAQAFLDHQRDWLGTRLSRQDRRIPFVAGTEIPVRGIPHRIVSTEALRAQVGCQCGPDGSTLLVPGGLPHLTRRLTDWLKAEARSDLVASVNWHASRLGVRPAGIGIRDQSTRWGSCSVSGRLNFNWRLILAPSSVLDYVAAHEVTHLVELNHSPAFWSALRRTLPDLERGRDWLKAHGPGLHAYGGDGAG